MYQGHLNLLNLILFTAHLPGVRPRTLELFNSAFSFMPRVLLCRKSYLFPSSQSMNVLSSLLPDHPALSTAHGLNYFSRLSLPPSHLTCLSLILTGTHDFLNHASGHSSTQNLLCNMITHRVFRVSSLPFAS